MKRKPAFDVGSLAPLSSRASFDPAFRQLAAAVVLKAVEDWVNLIHDEDKKKNSPPEAPEEKSKKPAVPSYDEIRDFFDSPYGEQVCELIDMDPNTIRSKLELWLEHYRSDGILPRKIISFGKACVRSQ